MFKYIQYTMMSKPLNSMWEQKDKTNPCIYQFNIWSFCALKLILDSETIRFFFIHSLVIFITNLQKICREDKLSYIEDFRNCWKKKKLNSSENQQWLHQSGGLQWSNPRLLQSACRIVLRQDKLLPMAAPLV